MKELSGMETLTVNTSSGFGFCLELCELLHIIMGEQFIYVIVCMCRIQ